MATSGSSANPRWLLLNLGRQEPRYLAAGLYRCLSDPSPAVRQSLSEDFGIPRDEFGLWVGARRIYELWDEKQFSLEDGSGRDRLTFPIAIRSLLYASDGGQLPIDRLVLVSTNSRSRQSAYRVDDPSNDDTYYAARLLEKYIRSDSTLNGIVGDIEILELAEDPHLYDSALAQVGRFHAFLKPNESTELYVCQSPGLPMVNLALQRQALKVNRRKTVLFQVVEPSEEEMRAGRISSEICAVPSATLLYDNAFALLPEFLRRHDYRAAIETIQALPTRPGDSLRKQLLTLLQEINQLWTLDIPPPADSVERKLRLMWVVTHQVDAWISNREWFEAVWRAGDVARELRDLCSSRGCAFDWKLQDIINIRNDLVHEFNAVTGQRLNDDVCAPLKISPNQLGELLRTGVSAFCARAHLDTSSFPGRSFAELNQQALSLIPD